MKSRDAVVLSADVFGYTRLINDFESETIERLVIYHRIFRRYVGRAGGRIFNYAGDAVLAEFRRIDDSLIAAVKIQQEILKHNSTCPLGQKMLFRMGINAGKVFERGTDLLGDTVNVAARLQAVAQPGGICISQGIYLGMSQGLDVATNDLGQQSLKNIPAHIQAYNVSFNQGSLRRKLNIPIWFDYIQQRPKVILACLCSIALVRIIASIHSGDMDAKADTKLTSQQSLASGGSQESRTSDPIPRQETTRSGDSKKSDADATDPVKAGLSPGSLFSGGLAAAATASSSHYAADSDSPIQPNGKRKVPNLESNSNQVIAANDDVPPSPDVKLEPIARCTLVIHEQTVIDAQICQYGYSAKYMTFAASSVNGKVKYLAKVNLNLDSTGSGFLSSATSVQERSLGTMVRKGACWISVDESVRMCAWK